MKTRLLFTLLFAVLPGFGTNLALAQIGVDDVIVSEFFDDILRINTGSVVDLFDIAENDNITSIAVADSGTAYVVNFTEIWKIDAEANDVSLFAEIDGTSPSEITMDLQGNLLVVNASDGVQRVDTKTGQISLVFDDTFFNADDIAVSAEGFIYATEFFDGLGRIAPGGIWTRLGDWDTNFFSHIDIGPDGYLYLSTTFEDGDIYRVNPYTGAGTKIADNVFDFIDDLQVASDGTIYVAGNRDTDEDGLTDDAVFTVDPVTGEVNIVVDEHMVGDPRPPFFNPMDIVIFDDVFYDSAPAALPPEFMVVNRGVLASGGIDDLVESDDVDLVIRRNASDLQSRTEFDLMATSVTANPVTFAFTFEASVFARSSVTQTICLFNYDTNQFEEVDSRPAQRFTDQIVEVTPSGDLSRFVQLGTNSVEAQIRFQSASPRQRFSSKSDQVRWTIK